MPGRYSVEIDHGRRLNTITVAVGLTVEIIKDMNIELWSRPDFDPYYGTLVILSKSSFEDMDHAKFREVFEWAARNDPRKGCLAVVHVGGAAEEAFARMVEAVRDTTALVQVRPFRHFLSVEEALAWIAEVEVWPPEGGGKE
ncbi:MAG: hypothetical protein OHK0024_10840 [Thalassobaculales bacterium]